MADHVSSTHLAFLDGGGRCGALIAARDWSATPLGPIAGWPPSLRTATAILLRSPVPMVMLWGEHGVMIYNDAYSVFAGRRHPTLLGSNVREGWVEVADFNDNVMRTGLAGGTLAYRDQELTLYRDGAAERVWMDLDYSPVPGEDGRPAGVLAIVIETTERVRAAGALQEARERAEADAAERAAILGQLGEGVIVTDVAGRITFVNDSAERLHGVKLLGVAPDAYARTYHLLTEDGRPHPPRDLPLARAVMDGETVVDARWRIRRPDGTEVLAIGSARPYLDAGGKPIGAVLTVRDDTARSRAEAALRRLNAELEERVAMALAEQRVFAEVVEATDAFVMVADTDFRLLAVNKACADEFEGLYGVRPRPGDDLLGLLDHRPEARSTVEATWARALAGEEFTVVGEFGDPDQERRHYEIKFNVLRNAAGAPLGAFQFSYDVTEEVRDRERLAQAEDALRQAQKMEAVGRLTGGIAHDFNNLLGAVVGSLDLIRRRPDDLERVRRYAEAGLQAAERGAKLTGQLLAFSRAQRIELKPLVVAELIEEMRDLLGRTLGPMTRLAFELGDGRARVLSDATQLEMAVLNLAINARDAMPDGGDLRIAVAVRRVDGDPELEPGDYVELSVADTGGGMPPDVAARAFDPFFTTKGVGKGTGLGLSQVYGVARQTGGAVRIDSRVGEGTTVRILLPRTDAAARAAPAADADGSGTRTRAATVLVVDDDPDVRRVLVDALDALGYRVVEAADGPAGLDALDREGADALVVDFAMPGMNGAEVARAARARRPDLPVVFASGYADTAAIEGAAGPDAPVLRKPFRVADLQAVLAGVLEGVGD